jgi:hypothetical protein
MFQFAEIIDAVKQLAVTDSQQSRSHCQALDFYARQLAFQSFYHMKQSLQRLPSDRFGTISLKLMRSIAEQRIPTLECPYYEFISYGDDRPGFYSQWIGWDMNGEEVRVPRPLAPVATAAGLRKPLLCIDALARIQTDSDGA